MCHLGGFKPGQKGGEGALFNLMAGVGKARFYVGGGGTHI